MLPFAAAAPGSGNSFKDEGVLICGGDDVAPASDGAGVGMGDVDGAAARDDRGGVDEGGEYGSLAADADGDGGAAAGGVDLHALSPSAS